MDKGNAGAYVFRATDGGATYGQVAKLTADDAAASRLLRLVRGIDVISMGSIVVGADGDDRRRLGQRPCGLGLRTASPTASADISADEVSANDSLLSRRFSQRPDSRPMRPPPATRAPKHQTRPTRPDARASSPTPRPTPDRSQPQRRCRCLDHRYGNCPDGDARQRRPGRLCTDAAPAGAHWRRRKLNRGSRGLRRRRRQQRDGRRWRRRRGRRAAAALCRLRTLLLPPQQRVQTKQTTRGGGDVDVEGDGRSAMLARHKDTSTIVQHGLTLANALLSAGSGLPLVGELCRAVKGCLGSAVEFGDMADDVLIAAKRVCDSARRGPFDGEECRPPRGREGARRVEDATPRGSARRV